MFGCFSYIIMKGFDIQRYSNKVLKSVMLNLRPTVPLGCRYLMFSYILLLLGSNSNYVVQNTSSIVNEGIYTSGLVWFKNRRTRKTGMYGRTIFCSTPQRCSVTETGRISPVMQSRRTRHRYALICLRFDSTLKCQTYLYFTGKALLCSVRIYKWLLDHQVPKGRLE